MIRVVMSNCTTFGHNGISHNRSSVKVSPTSDSFFPVSRQVPISSFNKFGTKRRRPSAFLCLAADGRLWYNRPNLHHVSLAAIAFLSFHGSTQNRVHGSTVRNRLTFFIASLRRLPGIPTFSAQVETSIASSSPCTYDRGD